MDANEVIDKEVVRTILMSLIKMSLFVECVSSAEITSRIDYFHPQLTKCFTPVIDCICDELPSPAGVEDVREVLYDHLHLVLPASYRPHLADRPVLLYSAVMNLRVYAGLANVMYTHLQEVVDGFDCVLLSKGNYVAFIESLTASKSLAPAVVCDIYSRVPRRWRRSRRAFTAIRCSSSSPRSTRSTRRWRRWCSTVSRAGRSCASTFWSSICATCTRR